MMVFCDLCHKRIPDGEPRYHQEIGWTKPRDGGGTNSLRLRESTGKFAHVACVQLGKGRIHLAQGSLI